MAPGLCARWVDLAAPVRKRQSLGGEEPHHDRESDLVALDIAQVLTNAGFEVVGPAKLSGPCSFSTLDATPPILDINLDEATSEPVARELNDRGTAFVTLTGYSQEQRASAFEHAAALAKPLQRDLLVAELRRRLEHKAEIPARRVVLPANDRRGDHAVLKPRCPSLAQGGLSVRLKTS